MALDLIKFFFSFFITAYCAVVDRQCWQCVPYGSFGIWCQ